MSKSTTFPKEKIKILLLEGVHPASLKLLKEHGYTDIETVSASLSESELKKKISQVHLLGNPLQKELRGLLLVDSFLSLIFFDFSTLIFFCLFL